MTDISRAFAPRATFAPAALTLDRRLRSLAAWSLVVVLAGYLFSETDRYRLLDLPMPMLVAGVVGGVLAGWVVAASVRVPAAAAVAVATVAGIAGVGLLAVAIANPAGIDRLIGDGSGPSVGRDAALVSGLAALGVAVGIGIAALAHVLPTATGALAVVAVGMMAGQDLVFFQTEGLRDLRLDLRAGGLFDQGVSPYLAAPLTTYPLDQTRLPFVYPPPTLPLFGVLAHLPLAAVETLWVVALFAAAAATMRLIGLGWRWTGLLLLWPAFAQGIYVGNVAILGGLLFAAGFAFGPGLVLGASFKLQGAIPALWLVRERRWRALVAGIGLVALICALTLPIVGLDRWRAWLVGLDAYNASARQFVGLYGIAMPTWTPYGVYLVAAVAIVAVGLLARGRDGLARLGLASVIASPSLYSHGFIVGLPAFLRLRAFWFWVVMALTSTILGPGWWLSLAIGVLAWFVPALRTTANEPLHPLEGREPWPAGGREPPYGSCASAAPAVASSSAETP